MSLYGVLYFLKRILLYGIFYGRYVIKIVLFSYKLFSLVIVVLLLLINGCTQFNNKIDTAIVKYSLKKEVLKTSIHDHVVFHNSMKKKTKIHIYIGGDGIPWIKGKWISSDPTSSDPLILRLMVVDSAHSILMGRPCYFGLAVKESCTSEMWTSARYSKNVLNSMEAAVREVSGDSEVVLFGYSGGAVIATLLANRLSNVVSVVTIAGNLDIKNWAREKGFLPLNHSINPIELAYTRSDILFIHIIGMMDKVVPPSITESFIKKHGGTVWKYPHFGHKCCWESEWPNILSRLDQAFIDRRY